MIVAVIIISLCLVLSIIIDRDIFSSATIVSAVWLFCVIAFNVYPHNLIPLRTEFYTNVTYWVALFSLITFPIACWKTLHVLSDKQKRIELAYSGGNFIKT